MQVTDKIADMLTRIRNTASAKHETLEVPASKLKNEVARILLEEGYIKNYEVVDAEPQGVIKITLKYVNKQSAITGIKRISKPGLRIYSQSNELPKVLDGLGIAIVSTSKGVMTDRSARQENVGGEVLAYVW